VAVNQRIARAARLAAFFFALGVAVAPLDSEAQQPLDLGPLPGVGQVQEYLVPGNGQGFLALATFYMRQPVIFYDGVWVQRIGGIGSPGFRFARAHEYAHHARGHVISQFSSPPATLAVLGYQAELDADCVAVRYLRSVGDREAMRAGFAIYQQVLPAQDVAGRPGAAVRTNNMAACADGRR
jgi:hypothetical protein